MTETDPLAHVHDLGPVPPDASAMEFATGPTPLTVRTQADGTVTLHPRGRGWGVGDSFAVPDVPALIEALRLAHATAQRTLAVVPADPSCAGGAR